MKLVVTHHRPLRKIAVRLALVGGTALAVLVALDYGHWKSIANAMIATGEKRTLLKEVVDLRRENETLHDQVAALKRAQAISRHARKDNHAELVSLQNRIAELESEINFYRNVVGATGVSSGPQVKGIEIDELEGDGRYRYKLVLTHVSKSNGLAEGSLALGIRGEQEGQRTELGYADVVESGPASLEFKFKHFHLFEGTLRIPQDFVPRQIHLAVSHGSRRKSPQPQIYDWASVLN